MPSPQALRAASRTAELIRRQAERSVACEDDAGRAAAQRLSRTLSRADKALGERLRAVMAATGGQDMRFTSAQASAYREQIRLIQRFVDARLAGLTEAQASAAVEASMGHTVDALARLEEHFTGIAIPVRLREALSFDAMTRGVQASLLRQQLTSVDRYGVAMIERFEETLSDGMLRGASQWEMVNELTGHAGPRGRVSMLARVIDGQVERLVTKDIPEGLFMRHRSWAWRIVRTETAHAYNAARLEGIVAMQDDFPDLGKKILATFDNRTAYDSTVVHGQVRRVDEYFVDGLGRQYLRPPGRPNDREVVIPWRMSWPETASTRPLTAEDVAKVRSALGTSRVRGVERGADMASERSALNARREQREKEQKAERRRASAAQRRATPAAPPPPPPLPPAPQLPPLPVAPAPILGTTGTVPPALAGTPEWYRYTDAQRHMGGAGVPTDIEGQREALGRALANGDGREARRVLRGVISNDGILSRDVLWDRENVDMVVSTENAEQRGSRANHEWDGSVHIAADVPLQRAGRWLQAGARVEPTFEDAPVLGRQANAVGRTLNTIFHEELHGCSPMRPEAYRMYGVVLEEVGVELQARDVTSRILGAASGSKSYESNIELLHGALPDSYRDRHPDLNRQLVTAYRRAWQTSQEFNTPLEYAEALVRNLPDSDALERAHFLTEIKTLYV